MINTHLKFEAKVPKWFKSCCIHKELHKIFKLKANLTFKVKVKVSCFQTRLRYLDDQ